MRPLRLRPRRPRPGDDRPPHAGRVGAAGRGRTAAGRGRSPSGCGPPAQPPRRRPPGGRSAPHRADRGPGADRRSRWWAWWPCWSRPSCWPTTRSPARRRRRAPTAGTRRGSAPATPVRRVDAAPASCPVDSTTPEVRRYWQDTTGIHLVIVLRTTCATTQTLADPAGPVRAVHRREPAGDRDLRHGGQPGGHPGPGHVGGDRAAVRRRGDAGPAAAEPGLPATVGAHEPRRRLRGPVPAHLHPRGRQGRCRGADGDGREHLGRRPRRPARRPGRGPGDGRAAGSRRRRRRRGPGRAGAHPRPGRAPVARSSPTSGCPR